LKLSTSYKNFGSIAQKLRNFFHILDRLGPNFNALKDPDQDAVHQALEGVPRVPHAEGHPRELEQAEGCGDRRLGDGGQAKQSIRDI